MQADFQNIRIVLVEPTHVGNIGAAARAMKTMGFTQLVLVNPPADFLCAEATAFAAGADDLLLHARVCGTVAEAISNCALVIGTTARQRRIAWPLQTPREMAIQALGVAQQSLVAILFGREHAGLTNDELAHCRAMVTIPTDENFSSLNLAASVQVIAYELRLAVLSRNTHSPAVEKPVDAPAAQAELENLFEHLQRVMVATDFFDPAKPRQLPRRLRRLFNRIALLRTEANILRGFLTAIEKKLTR